MKNTKDEIVITHARENNLKNISLTIPKNKLVVMTGLSGSGKTSLAFDTLYAEGNRRYMESLSTYARQFLGSSEKPLVESITGLSPAIAIDQKTTHNNPRSTVGTVTEIYDYLRLLFARVGSSFCPIHGIEITSQSPSQMAKRILEAPAKTRVSILAPVVSHKKGSHKDLLDALKKDGYIRVRVDGHIVLLDEVGKLSPTTFHDIDVVVDRISIRDNIDHRLIDSLETAIGLAKGLVKVLFNDEEVLFSARHACPICGFSVDHLEPRLFSFNAPLGACDTCKGLGFTQHVDPDKLIEDGDKSINEGGILYFKNTVNSENLEWQQFDALLTYYHIDKDKPLNKMTKKELDIVFYGSKEPISFEMISRSGHHHRQTKVIEGIASLIERRYLETNSMMYKEWVSRFMSELTCKKCHGKRLNDQALSVKIGGQHIIDWCDKSVRHLLDFIAGLELSKEKTEIASLILKEVVDRLQFLKNVGLDYLTLSRLAGTLSGGEAQRIRLANQIGSQLTGVLYVLDEPSIGLHQKDNAMLIDTLKQMRDLGNSIIVVEHDEDTMLASDWLVDIGPGAGIHGGQVMANGPLDQVIKVPDSITAQYLRGDKVISMPKTIRKPTGVLRVKKACHNNLKNIDVEFGLGQLNVVTGVSGSGKSSLVNDVLSTAVINHVRHKKVKAGLCGGVTGLNQIDKIVTIDQNPIGRTPRSNPATYTGVFDNIRDLFSSTMEAKTLGFDKGRFSFNVKGGRCEACQGDGVKRISMNFLPDIYVECEECHGQRYNPTTLSVKYKDKSIYDVLMMSVEEALDFFAPIHGISSKLQTLMDVGLGYIKLGQSSTTLSGGEAQRVKLASELQKTPTGKTLYILDEPTTGLHTDDVARLIEIFHKIVDNKDTVVVIEHNLDVVKNADRIIDLGPLGGDQGGQVVGIGSPQEIMAIDDSYTGQFLKQHLERTQHDRK